MAESKTDYERLKEKYANITHANDLMKDFLKKLDITLESIPDKQRELINHYVQAKKTTELHSLETSYFEEWFLLRCEKKFHDMEMIDDLTLSIAKYQGELDDDNEKIVQLENFLAEAHVKPPQQAEDELVMIEQKLAGATASFDELNRQEPPYCLDALLEKLADVQK